MTGQQVSRVMVFKPHSGDGPTMTKHQPVADDVVLVAIDVAKARNEVLIALPGQTRRRRLTVINTRAEHDRLVGLLSGLDKPVSCGFEATGNYHRPIAWRLLQAGFDVRLISSLALARTREALHNGWDKNDPKDAQVILHMLRIGASQSSLDPLAAGINDLQEISKTYEAVSKSKTEVLHRILTHHLPLYFPEIDRFRQNSRSEWFFAFLERFPTPAHVTALSKEGFVAAGWDIVGRKVSKERLLGDIYETARSSIGLPIPPDAPAVRMFRLVIAEARSLIRQRHEIESLADALLAESSDYKLLRRIPGVGPITALTILAEAGDLRRFGHHRQFLKFCGLDLATQQSGTFRGHTKLSKYGNARLRRALWMAGQVAIRQRENSFRDKFERYIARDRHNPDLRRKALTAITAKMARVVHALIKSGADYRPFVEGPVPGGRTSLSRAVRAHSATL
jgi:transposase